MRQFKPIANCPFQYKVEFFKDGTWQTLKTRHRFSLAQVDARNGAVMDWQRALELKKFDELRSLAQNLVEHWNSACPSKWRYTLEDTNHES
jgi:hypothetical protein